MLDPFVKKGGVALELVHQSLGLVARLEHSGKIFFWVLEKRDSLDLLLARGWLERTGIVVVVVVVAAAAAAAIIYGAD